MGSTRKRSEPRCLGQRVRAGFRGRGTKATYAHTILPTVSGEEQASLTTLDHKRAEAAPADSPIRLSDCGRDRYRPPVGC